MKYWNINLKKVYRIYILKTTQWWDNVGILSYMVFTDWNIYVIKMSNLPKLIYRSNTTPNEILANLKIYWRTNSKIHKCCKQNKPKQNLEKPRQFLRAK